MNQGTDKPDGVGFLHRILFVSAIILLPGFFGVLFGWVHGTIPLLVFYMIRLYGKNVGGKYILFGWLLAALASIVSQQIEQIFFSLSLIPSGYILAGSVERKENIWSAGVKTVLAIAGSWFVLSTLVAIGWGHHPYTLLIKSLNEGMTEAITYYKANASLPDDTLQLLEATFHQMQVLIPRIMPAMLTCIILIIVWFTMVLGNRLLQKKMGSSPWPAYKFWRLPDKLIWSVIISGILVAMPSETGRTAGLNLIIITGLLYCFQGIAIMLFYFYKWSVPLFLRTLIYVILFFQSFGVVFLALLGVADVWFDIRRLQKTDNETDT